MIRTASNPYELSWNWASLLWVNGKNIRVEDASRDYLDYQKSGGVKPFYSWLDDCRYNLIEEPEDEE